MTALRAISKTPEGVTIDPRNPSFELEKALAEDWAENDAFLTAVFNAMSLSFPAGERNFIDSVRHYEEQISDEKLLGEIRAFYKQEGIHSREHRKYNKILCEQRGYDLQHLEGVFIKRIEQAKNDPKVTAMMLLASTVSAEHFTASFGENILEGRLLKNVDGPIGDLWRWHSLEELEHKSIAMDVYNEVGGSYEMRAKVMRFTLFMFFTDTLKVAFRMLRQDKQLWKWKTIKSFTKFLFAKKGFIGVHRAAYKEFFREGFHPWDVDNRSLLEHWQKKLAPAIAIAP
ncbi:MAG: metal-dependent hydrolase [Pseudomonadales bacterium]